MAKYLNTMGTSYMFEGIITKATRHVVLISPYLSLNKRIKALISEGIRNGVRFYIMYGIQELKKSEKDWLLTQKQITLYYSEDVNARCYLNENHCLLSSMSLHKYAEAQLTEMSVFLSKTEDRASYQAVVKDVARLFRNAEKQNIQMFSIDFPPVLPPDQQVENPPASHKILQSLHVNKDGLSDTGKVHTAMLAARHRTTVKQLMKSFRRAGLTQETEGKVSLTEKGQAAGGEQYTGQQGDYFLWPEDLDIELLVSEAG